MSNKNVTEGYIEFENGNPDGKLLLFLTDPKFQGRESIKVTMGELIGWIIQSRE